MKRAECIGMLYPELEDKLVVTIMGACAQELYDLGHRENFFYLQHAMGLASSIGLGLAQHLPKQKIVVLDGDGSVLMNLGTLATLARDTVFVAELAGETAGYVAIEESAAALRIEQLCVHPAHEKEGVGKQLLEWAEGYAISNGADRLEVVVERGNDRAESFYRGRGFEPTAEPLPELFELEPEDVHMRKAL